jgi:broad specificity phosphatase PhoE
LTQYGGNPAVAKSSEIQLIVVPGARSEWDELGRLQGQADLPMSEDGAKAVAAIVDSLAADPIERVLTAPDEASVKTARAIARQMGLRAVKIESCREVSLGLWEGLEESIALERYPKVYGQWRTDPLSVVPPEGEPLEEAAHRIIKGLCKSLEKNAKSVVVVVLRPTAFAIVESWICDGSIGEHWPPDTSGEVVRRSLVRKKFQECPSLRVAVRTS